MESGAWQHTIRQMLVNRLKVTHQQIKNKSIDGSPETAFLMGAKVTLELLLGPKWGGVPDVQLTQDVNLNTISGKELYTILLNDINEIREGNRNL